jgi:hypothetical protein
VLTVTPWVPGARSVWLDYAGKERACCPIAAGADGKQNTFVTHVFRLRDEAGAVAGEVSVDAESVVFELCEPAKAG